jgi:GDPmannose 4,6-dehydratase
MTTALITGITGQDGAYLAEFLLDKGYKVYGMNRRSSSNNTSKLSHLLEQYPKNFVLRYGDLTDSASIGKLISDIKPDEVYNLGAQSHVQVSFENPVYTSDVDGLGTLRVLESIKQYAKDAKFYQASTSELFGKVKETPQNELTPFHPRSPYGVSKLFSYWAAVNYRESYGMYACNGILFNHESPIRGEHFVTRKITKAVASIVKGKQDTLFLGNLDAKRDWGFAKDYVEAMWLMLQQETPEDYVIATGETRTVREFVETAFKEVGIKIEWDGEGVSEVGNDSDTGKNLITIDPAFYRPSEVDILIGDPTKARVKLGWTAKTPFNDLVRMMVAADLGAKC